MRQQTQIMVMRTLFSTTWHPTARVMAALVLTSVLFCCNSGNDAQSSAIHNDGTTQKLTTLTPSLLRSIPLDQLMLTIKINDVQTPYSGMATSDGQWSIGVELEPSQEYDLLVQWYATEHLLLEEFGTFTTPATSAPIKPQLDYRSAGRAEFDTDCDGFSNLEEIIYDTSLTVAQGSTSAACIETEALAALMDTERVFAFREFESIAADESRQRFTSLEQSFQINTTNRSSNIGFITNLVANPVDATTSKSNRIAGWLSFRQRVDGTRFMEFAMFPASGIEESDIEGQFCKLLMSVPAGWMCTVPYSWQENRWYTISIDETTPTTWSALVRDQETQTDQQIATIITPDGLNWTELSTGIIDYIDYPSTACTDGLPASSLTFKSAIVNDTPVETIRSITSNCVKAGAGWSEGIRTVQGALEYKITLGRADQ